MQRIVLCYRKENPAGAFSHSEVRASLLDAVQQAGLPLGESRRSLLMGPPLPPNATSEAEQAVIELVDPQDPSSVCQRMNAYLPVGLRIVRAWIARPGNLDENPGTLDEAVYDVLWHDAVPSTVLVAAIRQFLAATEVWHTRAREHKVQQFNARALVRDLTLRAAQDTTLRIRMTLSVGPQGTLRPEEVLHLLCDPCTVDTMTVHRVALLRTVWRQPFSHHARNWRRYL